MIKLDLSKGTPQFDVWVKTAKAVGAVTKSQGTMISNRFSELNKNGEADIKDSELSLFQRLEMYI